MPAELRRLKPSNSRGRDLLAYSLMAGCCVFVAGVVLGRAWVSDDAFITFRYVDNVLRGYGPVFNLGERVQGYTHPLWFLLLIPGCWLFRDPVLVSIGYGLVFTVLAFVVWGRMLVRVSGRPLAAAGVLAVSSLVCVSSDPWVSFQTGGLENSLSHFLLIVIVAECVVHGVARGGRLTLYLALLCLARPDFAFFCAPLGVVLLWRARSFRAAGAIVLATSPLIAWTVFSAFYYGDVAPNTARAKVGVYPDWLCAAQRGWKYATDWIAHDTLAALAGPMFLACAVAAFRGPAVVACAGGAALSALYVVWVGGDFMRGRMFLAPFVAAMALGSAALAAQWRAGGKRPLAKTSAVASSLLVLFLASIVVSRYVPDTADPRKDVLNERKFYLDHSLRYYVHHGGMPILETDPTFIDELHAYTDAFGPIAIRCKMLGLFAYALGPKVSVIDMLGLTDRFIAGLPREYLIDPNPRAGHPYKYVPVAYLASRGDVALVIGWREAIRRKDPSLKDRVREYQDSFGLLDDDGRIVPRRVLEKNLAVGANRAGGAKGE